MDGVAPLDRACRAGLVVLLDGDRLVVRGPRRLKALAREVLANKPAVVIALGGGAIRAHDRDVAWRVETMQSQLQAGRPIPFLHTGGAAGGPHACLSCGQPLSDLYGVRCPSCREAAWIVVKELYPHVAQP